MSIKLAIAGGPPFELHDEVITLGSDPSCAVKFPASPEIKPKHAVIRSIAGRWLIEVREGDAIFVGGPEPRKLQWLSPGDEIRLFEQCPVVVFQPPEVSARIPSNSDPAVRTVKPEPKPAKSPSSGSVPARKANSSGTIEVSVSGIHSASDDSEIPLTASRQIGTIAQTTAGSKTSEQPAREKPVETQPKRQRFSSIDDLAGGRRTTSDQQDIQWIMTVVGRIVGAGVALVLIWLVISWLSKAFTPESINSLLVPGETIETRV